MATFITDNLALGLSQTMPLRDSNSVNLSSPTVRSTASSSTKKRRKRRKMGQPKVVVRIRPLTADERQQQTSGTTTCCIRPVLTKVVPAGTLPSKVTPLLEQQTSSLYSNQENNNPRGSSSSEFSVRPEEVGRMASTRLVCGTENPWRFEFDKVIGPRMTTKNSYHQAMGGIVRENVLRGVDTTILTLGHERSGTSYTLWGKQPWGFNMTSPSGGYLDETLGFLPQALVDLFATLEEQSTKSYTVLMSVCSISRGDSEGPTKKDLLLQLQSAAKIMDGLTWLQVGSVQDVYSTLGDLKDWLSERRHMVCTFQITNTASIPGLVSKLSFVQLRLKNDETFNNALHLTKRNKERDLCSLLVRHVCVAGNGPLEGKFEEAVVELSKCIQSVLEGVEKPIMIACVSPSESDLICSKGLLRLVEWASETCDSKHYRSQDSPREMSSCSTSLDSESVLTNPTRKVLRELSTLRETLKIADEAAQQAKESSTALQDKAARWKSQREKLRNASKYDIISKSHKRNTSKRETRQPQSEERENATKNPRAHRRHGPRLLRERSLMKSAIKSLVDERTRQEKQVGALQVKVLSLNSRLEEEQQVNTTLEQIRDLLSRKCVLQEERIKSLEYQVGNVSLSQLEVRCYEAPKQTDPNATGATQETTLSILEPASVCRSDTRDDVLLSMLDASTGSVSMFLDADDLQSPHHSPVKITLPRNVHTSQELANAASPTKWNFDRVAPKISPMTTNPIPHKEEGSMDSSAKNCSCQVANLSSCNAEDVCFFLPARNSLCICQNESRRIDNAWGSLNSLLRPWQAQFLSSLGLYTVPSFIAEYERDQWGMAKLMVNWRACHGHKAMNQKSCGVALRIWARSLSMNIVGSHEKTTSSMKRTRSDIMELASSSECSSLTSARV